MLLASTSAELGYPIWQVTCRVAVPDGVCVSTPIDDTPQGVQAAFAAGGIVFLTTSTDRGVLRVTCEGNSRFTLRFEGLPEDAQLAGHCQVDGEVSNFGTGIHGRLMGHNRRPITDATLFGCGPQTVSDSDGRFYLETGGTPCNLTAQRMWDGIGVASAAAAIPAVADGGPDAEVVVEFSPARVQVEGIDFELTDAGLLGQWTLPSTPAWYQPGVIVRIDGKSVAIEDRWAQVALARAIPAARLEYKTP